MTFAQPDESERASSSFMALANLDQAALDALPQAFYLCAGDGRVVRFNQKAVELWARAPRPGDPQERFCGSLRLYRTDGTHLPHDQCPVATALQTGESFHNQEVVVEQPGGQRLTVLVNIAALKDEEGRVNGAINCFQDISDRKREEERQRQAIRELTHRIKNTLAMVLSMAVNTARDANTMEEFKSCFQARLLSLSRAHTLLGEDRATCAKLHDLLAQQLEPFGAGESPRVRFEGPEIDLDPQAAVALSMVFHELMTNAAKYGALSVADGQISVNWELVPEPEPAGTLILQWRERGGPPVTTPQRQGFGTRLIRRMLSDGLDGRADLTFEPSGVQLQISIPLRKS